MDGVARGVPLFNIGNAIVYRKDVFEELGLAVPNTWDEYLEVGRALKNNNLPVGQTLGHTFGDAPRSPIRCCGASAARRSTSPGRW